MNFRTMVIVLLAIYFLNGIYLIILSYDECIRDCESALTLNGKFSKGYSRLAKSYLALGNFNRAYESYEKAMEVAPTDKDLLAESKRCKLV